MFKGWSNGERALAVGLSVVIVVFLFGVSVGNGAHDKSPYDAAQGDGDHYLKLADLVAQWVMAAGTLLLFGLTWKSLKHSEKTAADALRASTNATQAAINAERGKLIMKSAKLWLGVGEHVLTRVFVNIGSGPLVIKEAHSQHDIIPLPDDPDADKSHWPKPAQTFALLSEPGNELIVAAGEVIEGELNDDGSNILRRQRRLSLEEVLAIDTGKKMLFIQYKIVYETMFGYYDRRIAWMCWNKGVRMIKDKSYNKDMPIG